MSEYTPVTVNLIPAAIRALDQAAQIEENTRTDTVNRALQVYAFLVEKTKMEDFTVYIADKDGDMEKVTIT